MLDRKEIAANLRRKRDLLFIELAINRRNTIDSNLVGLRFSPLHWYESSKTRPGKLIEQNKPPATIFRTTKQKKKLNQDEKGILFQVVPRSKYQFFLLGIILKLASLLAVSLNTFRRFLSFLLISETVEQTMSSARSSSSTTRVTQHEARRPPLNASVSVFSNALHTIDRTQQIAEYCLSLSTATIPETPDATKYDSESRRD